jgi:hypothetical protein
VTAPSSTWREAVVLPWLLLGIALAASLRITVDGELRVLPPPLSALVLALLVITVLVRCGQLVPARLVGAGRSALESAGGVVVLVALGWASAAIIALVTPEAGLPKLAGLILATALLANTLAASTGRVPALRALFVTCAAGFVVKFIVLDALYEPSRGLAGRMLTAVLDGVTLGGFGHVPWAPITGYVAFGTVLLYFVALSLLPRDAGMPAARGALASGVRLPPHPVE